MPAWASAGAVASLLLLVLWRLELGPLAADMARHIALMNVAAPLAAMGLIAVYPFARIRQSAWLWLATAVQIVLLWACHAPSVHAAAAQMVWLQAGLYVSLLAVALLFWISVLRLSAAPWQPILALLITGKLSCLLGSILIFAPRLLYPPGCFANLASNPAAMLADQQLAGLLMIAACPLSYVAAGVIIAARMMAALGRTKDVSPSRASSAG